MSRYNPKHHSDAVFKAAAAFKSRALIDGYSIFGDEKIWSAKNFGPLVDNYVHNPLDGNEGSMVVKLGQQLRPCPPESIALFAEIYWILLLGPTNLKPEKKRDRIRYVWALASTPISPFPVAVDTSTFLNLPALSGLGSAGPGFNMLQWKELQFAVVAFQALMALPDQRRINLLDRPWEFAEWLDEFPEAGGRQFYHCLCHLLFPDEFERIFSERDKARAARSPLLGISPASVGDRPSRDQAIYAARQVLEQQMGTLEVDFYKNPPILLRSKSVTPPRSASITEFFTDAPLAGSAAPAGAEADDDTEAAAASEWEPLNRIYFGPPGTGKTYALEQLRLERFNDGEHIEFVSFHPSYSYEDFVEGFRPEPGNGGQLGDKPVKGPFLQICERAHLYPGDRHTLFIDEINRANVAKVFGELITVLETSKRCKPGVAVDNLATSVRLQYSGEKIAVPRNLDIIASMNTADRSVTAIDHALRRRFEFIECPANPDLIMPPTVGTVSLARLLSAINDRIEFMLDRDHAIGHAILMNIGSIEQLRDVFSKRVIPLLLEYFFEDALRAKIALTGKAGRSVFFNERPLIPDALFEGCEDLVGHEPRAAIHPSQTPERWTELDFRLLYDRRARSSGEPAPAEPADALVSGLQSDAVPAL